MTLSNEERLARLEGGYEHLATKADVESLRAEFKSDLAALQDDRLNRLEQDVGTLQRRMPVSKWQRIFW